MFKFAFRRLQKRCCTDSDVTMMPISLDNNNDGTSGKIFNISVRYTKVESILMSTLPWSENCALEIDCKKDIHFAS